MIAPKYTTNYFYTAQQLAVAKQAPNVVNLYFDYNCRFSSKLYFKLYDKVIPQLNEKHPNRFQFVYVNVIQPWHPNSTFINEFALAAGQLLRAKAGDEASRLFWELSRVIFVNQQKFWDSYNVELNRNQIYKQIYDVVSAEIKLPFTDDEILPKLTIKPNKEEPNNGGNATQVDVKYFTRYLRNAGVHVTPTISVNGIVDDSISSGSEIDQLVQRFESHL